MHRRAVRRRPCWSSTSIRKLARHYRNSPETQARRRGHKGERKSAASKRSPNRKWTGASVLRALYTQNGTVLL